MRKMLKIAMTAMLFTGIGGVPMASGAAETGAAKDYVSYSEFGAVGDGKTDDFDALQKAHNFANKNNLKVRADKGATYYLSGAAKIITIQTDTDWTGAEFIIDDVNCVNSRQHIFYVSSKLPQVNLSAVKSLKKNQAKLDVKLATDCFVVVTDESVKRYIRFGLNQNNGAAQTDVFLIDKNGNVDANTPIIWDFERISTIEAYPIDTTTLTITGGVFTTIANRQDSRYNYYGRAINIVRSNVVVENITHKITGELETGAPYSGFIYVNNCANVQIKNSLLTGHKTYETIGAAGKPVRMGSYDLHANRSANVSFINITQTTDIMDSTRWGIFGSNYCKNLTYDGCTLSRFDAHMGVANATIRNSKLGYMGINAIGCGVFTIENSIINGTNMVNLREDYGSTWEGEFVIRDCTYIPYAGVFKNATLFSGHNSGQHDFGYVCYMPRKITIENLTIDDSNAPAGYTGPRLFADFNPENTSADFKQAFPYVLTEEVVISGLKIMSGLPLQVSPNKFMFSNVKVTQR